MITGSLQEKNSYYYVVARIDDGNGKKKQKWISTKIRVKRGNKREAIQAMKDILDELNEKVTQKSCDLQEERCDISFIGWMDEWILKKARDVRCITIEGYQSYMRLHIKPYFEPLGLTLPEVSATHLNGYIDWEINKGASPNSIVKYFAVIGGSLHDAFYEGVIKEDPSNRVRMPKQKKYSGKSYTPEQVNELMSVIEGDIIKPAVVLAAVTGLRRSEVLGMRWKDIDPINKTLIVQNTVTRMYSTIESEQTKSESSMREIPLTDQTVEYLMRLKAKQALNQEEFGCSYVETGHVCVWEDGRPISPSYLTNHFKKLLEQNGLPTIRFHDLRHTAGSILLSNGATIKQVQEYLGHSKASTTLNTYIHINRNDLERAADILGSAVRL